MATDTLTRSLALAASLVTAAVCAASAHPASSTAPCRTTRTLLTAETPSSLALVRTLGHETAAPSAYGWPVKPFDRQHPVRAFLDDPRIGAEGSHAFHFGIDVAAPDGTAVYAVAGGEVFFNSPQSIAVKTGPSRVFGYWHIIPVVTSHEIVGTHQLLGHIGPGWGHVHFAERVGGIYVNPLRRGGIGPYTDPLAPTVRDVTLVSRTDGRVDVVTNAYDTTWPTVDGAWANEPVTPALLQWRIVREGSAAGVWQTAADFRSRMLDASRYGTIYTPGTTQNHMGVTGAFCFYLARGWKPANGSYRIEVAAFDTRGNSAVAHVDVDVENGKMRQSGTGL